MSAKNSLLTVLFLLSAITINAQVQPANNYVSKVWVADLGNGMYKNPVLNADYSDPDAIRVGNDYYLTASSFEDIPGLPILHSKDLVNWKIIGHALKMQIPAAHFSVPRHGQGVWAPSIRFRNGEFYIYYPDPDFGVYVTKSKNAAGPWSEPVLVQSGKGLIDPCPLWDDDGNVYLVHAYAGSRSGIGSIIVVNKLNAQGTKVLDDGVLVYDGNETDPTIEGPKFYKANGYYYIFAPAGGVTSGWQVVLRSKNIYGPYERKVVMHQGATTVNGPHQGAWVHTPTGEDWFLHFQDKGPYGRVLHLNPMKWVNGWPIIGADKDGEGAGEPVLTYKKPNVGKTYPIITPAESDEFNNTTLGLQWQWMANPKPTWAFMNPAKGALRLYTQRLPDSAKNLWDAPNLLLQKFPADEFMVTTKLSFIPAQRTQNEKAGITVMGFSYANLALKSKTDGLDIVYTVCKRANAGQQEQETVIATLAPGKPVYLRVEVRAGGKCRFSYSLDGASFSEAGNEFQAEMGRWIGAKMGLFATRENATGNSGFADVDWFRIEAIDTAHTLTTQPVLPRVTIALLNGRAADIPKGPYKPSWESIKENYKVPDWFVDGKFGIFIHYGVYTVAAHASEWYAKHMYNNDEVRKWHEERFGRVDSFGYQSLIPLFTMDKFKAAEWAELFKKAGAKYVVPTAEHHDGFAMYDSKLTKWDSKDMGPKIDFIGELGTAVRKQGLKFGVSNHRMENWDFMYPQSKIKTDLFNPEFAALYGPPQPPPQRSSAPAAGEEVMEDQRVAPQSKAFLEEWLARCQELVDKYKPDMFWFDNGVNSRSLDSVKLRFAAYYYNRAAAWGKQVSISTKSDAYLAGSIKDFERQGRAPKEITDYVWQVDDPIGEKFGYVEGMKLTNTVVVVRRIIENVCRNGNYMLNISPKSDGTIPKEQQDILLGIGKWLEVNGDGIYGTRAWTKYGEGDVRFTKKGNTLYAIVMKWPTEELIIPSVQQSMGKVKSVTLLGYKGLLTFTQDVQGLKVNFPREMPSDIAWTLKIQGLELK